MLLKISLKTGLRSFAAQPVLSSDTPGDKHKMERWLRAGHQAMASVYAPISYAPLPVLAFKVCERSSINSGINKMEGNAGMKL
jgi:hypothetical protein